jgi:hypothetical protein
MIDKITATTAPGTTPRQESLEPQDEDHRLPTANATVQPLASLRCVIVDHCCSNQLPVPFGIPSMSGICP